VRYAIAILQGIFITAAIGIIIYVIVEASDVFGNADFCQKADNRETACSLASAYNAQATALVAWALGAVGLAVCAAAIRWWGGPARQASQPTQPSQPMQGWQPTGTGQWPGQQQPPR
jgi:hypothetical protein